MSDEHHEHNGGHELENLDAGALFKVIGMVGFVVVLSAMAVTQFFYAQRNAQIFEVNPSTTGFTLNKYWQDMDEQKVGLPEKAKAIAANPATLKAAAPPEGWVHPDDLKQGKAE